MRNKLSCIVLLFGILLSNVVYSQTTPSPAQTIVDYSKISTTLATFEKKLKAGNVPTEVTVDYIKQLNDIRNQVSDDKKNSEQELGFVQKRIEALGAVPEDGAKEAYSITQKRKSFAEEASKYKSKIVEADVTIAKVDELDNLVLTLRNQELLGNILDKNGPLIYPTNFFHSTILFVEFVYDVVVSPYDWYVNLSQKEKTNVQENMYKVCTVVFSTLILAFLLSYIIRKKFGYKSFIENPDYNSKVFASIAVFVSYGAIPSTLIGGFMLWMVKFGIIDKSLFTISLFYALLYLLFGFLSQAVVRVVFVVENKKWRLFEVSNKKAKSLSHAMLFSIIMICGISFFESVAEKSNYSIDLQDYLSMISSAIKAFCIVVVTQKLVADYNIKLNSEEQNEEEKELSPATKAVTLLSLFMLGTFSFSLFGYVKLVEFIFNRFIISCVVLVIFYIVNRVIKEIFKMIFSLRFWNKSFRITKKTMTKMNFWFAFLLNPIMFFMCVMVVLAFWGVSVDLLLHNIERFLTEFSVGGIKISIISILFGIFVFFVSLYIFKFLKKYVLLNVLVKTELDDGVRNSLSSGFGFIGYVASALFAISVMGGSLGNLALIAGALSFGVGLGFQNIVSNLVSGIIILFERPFKIGDWVIINGQEGIVKQINIRATEIENFNKSSVLIPNGTILSSSLTNMTLHNKIGRVDVTVGVGYGSDIKKVREILLDIASKQPGVLKNPAPSVTFSDLAASSMDFVVKCHISDVSNKSVVANNIREEIINRFSEENIDIPFPQLVVHADK